MFFSKNKKTDSKIRFQQTGFRKQLQSARGYKRPGMKNPVLVNIWPKVIAMVAILGLIYLIYIPNFLFIKHINVNGVGDQDKQQIIDLSNEYLKQQPFKAQGNWIFLDQDSLAKYIEEKSSQITKIESIKKKFSNTLNITVIPRTTAFNVTTPLQQLLVSNDGLVSQDITSLGTSTPAQTSGLTAITIDTASSTYVGNKIFSDSLIEAINTLKDLTHNQLKLSLNYFEVQSLPSMDITEYLNDGFKVMFNRGLNLQESVNQLQLLLSNMQDSQKKTLYYIDMRFDGKGFVCYKNTACVQNTLIQSPIIPTATTTP